MPTGVYDRKAKVGSGTEDVAPKKSHTAKYKKINQEMIAGIVDLINLPLAFVVPVYALTQVETDALTVAITDLAMTNVWVNNLLYNLVATNNAVELPIVLAAIAVNKLIIAQKVPEMAGIATEGMLQAVASRRGKGKANVVTRSTRSPDRADGIGQDDAGPGASQATGVYPLFDNQTGHDDVAGPLEAGADSKRD